MEFVPEDVAILGIGTYWSVFIQIWPGHEAVEVGSRADVSVDVGVVDADEEV